MVKEQKKFSISVSGDTVQETIQQAVAAIQEFENYSRLHFNVDLDEVIEEAVDYGGELFKVSVVRFKDND